MPSGDGARAQTLVGEAVTARSFVIGLVLSAGIAAFNCWIETVANLHFIGGVQMPFGAIFSLIFLVLAINGPLKWVQGRWLRGRAPRLGRVLAPLSSLELVAIYAMMLFGALISTPGADNLFLTVAPALFYFSTRENGWAELFYNHVPRHFAPGWDGHTFQKSVIEPLYLGGVAVKDVPWHAWIVMLVAWGIFLLLAYSLLFWFSLLLRRQWIENEALTFPLVQLPLQMVESSHGAPPGAFWSNRTMWAGVALAAFFHILRGLNNFYPDWPVLTSFQGNTMGLLLTERPWNAMGNFPIEIYLGAIGISYLLTRELVFSFWFCFLLMRFELVAADRFGFPAGTLPIGSYVPMGGRPQPTFIAFQSMGGWAMIAVMLLWTARGHISLMWREACKPGSVRPERRSTGVESEPFAASEPFPARIVFLGLFLSFAGMVAWCAFSGISIVLAIAFLVIYLLTSLVMARVVVEGGFLFPQSTYMPMEWMTSAMFGTAAVGLDNLTKLSFVQASLMTDMRTNTLPAFLHALKMAHERDVSRSNLRRLCFCVMAAIVVSMVVTLFTSVATLYSNGALASYSFSATLGPQRVFAGAATVWAKQAPLESQNLGWMALGAAVVWGLLMARSRFVWFPLHPLGYIMAPSYGVYRLWFSFFVGWIIKSLILKFGGQDAHQRARPFMLGLILGNAAAMVFWMIIGFFLGGQIAYWPA